MITPILVVGAGGFGRETLDVVEAVNAAAGVPVFEVLGVVDDAPSTENLLRLKSRQVEHLGGIDAWLSGGSRANYILAVGDPTTRRGLVERFASHGLTSPTIVHPSTVLGSQVVLGAGTVVCAGVQISTNVEIGSHVHVNAHATIGHDTILADYVSINPAATVSGECTVANGVLVGAASVVLQGLHISAGSTVGAGACVVRDVEPGATVKGVPAR